MLSKERNDILTRIGPGTPAGNLLRRYWQPLCPTEEVTAERPKKLIRILCEDMMLFRTAKGEFGLIEAHCAHRGSSLYYGFVEDDGIRCPYHGIKYSPSGACVDLPFEPPDSPLKKEMCQRAYPVEELGGMLFAYMGPAPKPLLPRWDILVRDDGMKKVTVLPVLNCNWLQIMENSADTAHTYYLHAHMMAQHGKPEQGAYYYRPIKKMDFEIVKEANWGGLRKARTYGGEEEEKEKGHPILFPNALLSPERQRLCLHYRVPIDDTHTQVFRYEFRPSEAGKVPTRLGDPVPVEYLGSFRDDKGDYILDATFAAQDAMAYETQGAIADRTREHLTNADRGVAMYRKLLLEQIEVVRSGDDPIGVIRDPNLNERIVIDVSSGQAKLAEKSGILY